MDNKFRAGKRTAKNAGDKTFQEKLLDNTSEPINFGMAYSALLGLIILTEHYLLHTKFLMLLGLSVIVIVVTWIALAIRLLAIGLLFVRNRMVYSISMALLLPSFAVSVIFIAHPIVRYLIHKLIG